MQTRIENTISESIDTVERERERELLFYSTWNLSTRPSSFIEIKKGGNTFICDKRKGRLDLDKNKS